MTDPGDDLGAAFAIGIQTRDLPGDARPRQDRAARLYAEWVWASARPNRGDVVAGRPRLHRRGATDRSRSSTSRSTTPGPSSTSTSAAVDDGAAAARAPTTSSSSNNECAPADGCPTLQSSPGEHPRVPAGDRSSCTRRGRAGLRDRPRPAAVASIDEPTHRFAFVPGIALLHAVYDEASRARPRSRSLTVSVRGRHRPTGVDAWRSTSAATPRRRPTTVP